MTGPQTKALRIALGLSYTKFARLMGVATSTVQRWEQQGAPYPACILLRLIMDDHSLVKRISRG